MITSSAYDLIRRSLLLINAIGEADTPSASMMNDALTTLNELLDNWSTETMSVYGQDDVDVPLIQGVREYSWGLTGDINSIRPVRLISATCTLGGVTSIVDIIGDEKFEEIAVKSTQSRIIEKVSYSNSYPLGKLKVYPTPAENNTGLKIVSYSQLVNVPNLVQIINLPPGYQRALRYSLAVELWPEYPNPSVDIGTIKQIAMNSKADIKRANTKEMEMSLSDIPGQYDRRGTDWRFM